MLKHFTNSFIDLRLYFSFSKHLIQYEQANSFLTNNIYDVNTYDEFKKIISNGGFVRCGWDGLKKTETVIKDETKATIRCIPFDEQPKDLICVYSGNPAKPEVIFANAY